MRSIRNLIQKPFIIYLLVIILAVFQIFISNRLANYGEKLSNLAQKTNEKTLDNERIKKKIASFSAITTLSLKAKELGFEKKAQVMYLDDRYSVAQNPL